ncbi:helix-turn-helix domain-containing protein [Streptantibioticus cattleyicolor]|nr:AraC family transcriptional regulator [Streptantibioticus cattleyicolor]CCB71140.1 Transcriptional regulator [Streptantibioticus cattleyicolor NRRL 8057 = DSM 46488]
MRVVRAGGVWRVTRPLHPGLRPFVCGYAGYRVAVALPYQARVVPTGRAVVVINLAEPFSRVRRLGLPGAGSGRIGSLVVGLEDRPAICEHPGGQEAIRLELTPLGAYRLFAVPMGELTNHVIELPDVLGPGAGELVERLAATGDWTARCDLLDAALLDRFGEGPAPAPEVEHAWRLLAATAGTIPIARVAEEVGWSQKHLARRFEQQVGLTPKRSARVLRFQRAMGMLTGGRASADTAMVSGFYDQAHLVREFRALAGVTPGQVVGARRTEGALVL